jgi:hypothetical protein
MNPRSILLLLPVLLCWPFEGVAFETNAKIWPAMPIPYVVNAENAPDFGSGLDAFSAVQKATENWSQVPCADVSFQFTGATTATMAPDGQNTIFWISEGWGFGDETAGATVWITPTGDSMEVDLALNAEYFEWVAGGGSPLEDTVIDPVSVLTHELGHWLGLAHSPDEYATMYSYQIPNAIQATLDGDDKAGICSLYPSGTVECVEDSDCPDGYHCTEIQGIPVCAEIHDPPGSFCSLDKLNCADMCWISLYECSTLCVFTAADYSKGYCSLICEDFHDCPLDFECHEIPAMEGGVCDGDPAAYEDYLNPPEPQPDSVETDFTDLKTMDFYGPFETVGQPDVSAPDPGSPEQTPDTLHAIELAGPEIAQADSTTGKSSNGCGQGRFPPCGTAVFLLLAAAFLFLLRVTRSLSVVA